MKKCLTILFILFKCFCVATIGQEKQVIFNHLTESNGLLSNDVTGAIFEDSYGFIWICSREGLARYDGSGFRVFQFERNNPNTIHTNNINLLCESDDKRLLIATSNGIGIYDMLTETFTTLYNDPENPEYSPLRNHINAVIPETNNRFWVYYLNDFSLFDLNTGKFRHFTKQEGFKDRFVNMNIFKIEKGLDNAFYLGIENDYVYKWKDENWQKLPIQTKSEFMIFVDQHGLILIGGENFRIFDQSLGFDAHEIEWNFSDSKIVSIKQDYLGNIWAGFANDGLYMISPRTRQVLQHFTTQTTPGISSNKIEKIHVAGNSLFIQFAKGFGFMRYNHSVNNFETYKHNPRDPFSISPLFSKYSALTMDNGGVYWWLTESMGINFNDFKQSKFSILTNDRADAYPIKGAINRGVYASNNSSIWLGNDKALYRYDRIGKKFETFPHSIVNSIYAHDEKDIWIGGEQLINYNYSNGRLSRKRIFVSNPTDPTSLSHWYVTYVNKTRDGELWVCTSGGFGQLNQSQDQPGAFKNYFHNPNDSLSLPGRLVWHFHEDNDGLLWIATQSGLAVFDRKTEKFKQYKHDPKDINSLSSDNVKFINQDYKGRIWVATEGGGLCMLDKTRDTFINYTIQDGLPSNSIYGILSDEDDFFWLSTKKGISTFHPDSMVFTNYFVSDGLQANSFNIQSFSKNSETNELIFGGPGGFTLFHPKQIIRSDFIPKIYITGLRINNKIVYPGTWKNGRKILKQTILETDSIELNHDENSIILEFAALHFAAPENIKYKYKLDGFDDSWLSTDNKRNNATYTNLPPGKYTFRLMATNSDGIWSPNEKILFIKIIPPWWKTVWFRLVLVVSLVITTGSIFLFRIMYLERARTKLKRLIQQKTEELSEKNEELNQQNEMLASINQSLTEQQTQIIQQNSEINEQREHLTYNNEILKAKNTEILKISRLLHDADQSKIRFFTNISHELRTPFSLILGPLESLVERTVHDNYLHSRLNIILNNANRLLRLINQILDFKKIDNNTINLSLKQKDIVAFSKNIYDAHQLVAEKKNIIFTFSSNIDAYTTWFDPDKIDKILYNLLSNAFKFTPENGKISIDCMLDKEEHNSTDYDLIRFSIKDNGIGISKEYIEKIFDRFFQIDLSDTRQYEGSGIGLSLTKHLVELHDGSIQVTSEINKGTCFEVKLSIGESLKNILGYTTTLDIDNKETIVENKYYKKLNTRKSGLATDKPLLLLVEDNDELRSYIQEELSDEFEILEAKNGREGLSDALKHIPDIIISDVMMPLMDGFEMCETIKNEWLTSHIPIIMLTAKIDEKSQIQGLEIGADAYIKKPFQIKRLKAQIENLILNRKKLQLKFKDENSMDGLPLQPDYKKDDFVLKMSQIIEDNISNSQLGVEFLASNLNMSRSKLYKKTYALLNISAGELIRDMRLRKAADLLKNSDNNITEISLLVGFSDHPQFTRSFTNQFGMNPKKYQTKHSTRLNAI